jgi:membrane protease YdiL (CAAX protease family)
VEIPTKKTSEVAPWEAILVLVVTFFVVAFAGAAILFTLGDGPTLVLGELLILIVPLSYLLYKRVKIREFARIEANPKLIAIGVGCGALLLPLNILVSGALTAIFGTSAAVEQSNQLYANLSSTDTGLIMVATSLALAGICEEFAFRGFLQNSIFKSLQKNPNFSKYAFGIAVLIAAAVFGIFHFDPQLVYIIATFIAGIALGYIYSKWGYTTSATAHASMNLMVLVLLLLGH